MKVDAVGGMDMGWPFYEGPNIYSTCTLTPPAPLTAPIAYYDHSIGLVIICGGLYRQAAAGILSFPAEYEGDCFFLDYYSGIMRRLKGSGTSWALAPPVAGQPDPDNWGLGFDSVSDMLEMSDGSLWYCRQTLGIAMPGKRRLAFTSPRNFAQVMPRGHWSNGLSEMIVSNIESGAGSVDVSACPALPKTVVTSGNFFSCRS